MSLTVVIRIRTEFRKKPNSMNTVSKEVSVETKLRPTRQYALQFNVRLKYLHFIRKFCVPQTASL